MKVHSFTIALARNIFVELLMSYLTWVLVISIYLHFLFVLLRLLLPGFFCLLWQPSILNNSLQRISYSCTAKQNSFSEYLKKFCNIINDTYQEII